MIFSALSQSELPSSGARHSTTVTVSESLMDRLTAEAMAELSKGRRSAIEEWVRKRERHEEFAVRGSTSVLRHNEEISRIVLSCLRKIP